MTKSKIKSWEKGTSVWHNTKHHRLNCVCNATLQPHNQVLVSVSFIAYLSKVNIFFGFFHSLLASKLRWRRIETLYQELLWGLCWGVKKLAKFKFRVKLLQQWLVKLFFWRLWQELCTAWQKSITSKHVNSNLNYIPFFEIYLFYSSFQMLFWQRTALDEFFICYTLFDFLSSFFLLRNKCIFRTRTLRARERGSKEWNKINRWLEIYV